MRRSFVLLSVLVVLFGLTIWVTSLGKVGNFDMFNYKQIMVHFYDHLVMVGLALVFCIIIGTIIGVLLTRSWFSRIASPIIALVSMGQAMPSMAVIAIFAILPITLFGLIDFGFNIPTVIIALVIYGLMPVVRNCYASINNINRAVIESAEGMGMTKWQIFWKIEMPVALPVMVTGYRISGVLAVGTAELAVLVGGKGLGTITFTGVFAGIPALIIQGAAPTAIMAILIGVLLEGVENWITPRGLKLRSRIA